MLQKLFKGTEERIIPGGKLTGDIMGELAFELNPKTEGNSRGGHRMSKDKRHGFLLERHRVSAGRTTQQGAIED